MSRCGVRRLLWRCAGPYTSPLVARTKKGVQPDEATTKGLQAAGVPSGQAAKRARAGAALDGEAVDDAMGIDEILDGLEQVVQQLEAGDLPLEEALRRFEHGVGLARRGSSLLDGVEERVEQLLADRDEAVPFTSED